MQSVIMWIDDDGDLLVHQRDFLMEEGFAVVSYDTVEAGLAALAKSPNHYAGIVVDVMMEPDGPLLDYEHNGGFDTGACFVEHIRGDVLLRDIRMFIYTNRRDIELKEKVKKFGVNYYLKSDYKGSKICDLVNKEFGRSVR